MTEITADPVGFLRASPGNRVWIFYQRRAAAGPPPRLDVGVDVAYEPRPHEIDLVFSGRLEHEKRRWLPALTSILGPMEAVEKLRDRRALELTQQLFVNRFQRGHRGKSLRGVGLIGNDKHHPALFCCIIQRFSHA